jgi:UDP-glucose 4-epimerase
VSSILITGSAGFIAGYLVQELLDQGHSVIGVDNFSKYGRVEKSYDGHPRYQLVDADVKDTATLTALAMRADYFVAGAAMIGGISYFHAYAYDLLAENERIMASSFDAAIRSFRESSLAKVIVISSSMVFENSDRFPTAETDLEVSPPPTSTYGFQKLASEYFARGAWEQYRLPFTIVRPFNCVGIGEKRALGGTEISSGNIKLAMSHVVPDLVQKVVKGQDPLHILGDGSQVRCYTYGGDLAKGIARAIFDPAALNQDFNLSTSESTTVLELARLVWDKVHARRERHPPFRFVSDSPFPHDVPRRIPDTTKARRLLGFEATTPLSDILDEVIPWIEKEIEAGGI